jgi:trans-aconitate methyltransferase
LKALAAGVETWAVTNETQARYWNGDEAVPWLVHEQRYERMLAPFTDHLLTAATSGGADRVVDIGCGPGQRGRPGHARTVRHARWPAAGIPGMARHREQAMAVKRAVIAASLASSVTPRARPGGLPAG